MILLLLFPVNYVIYLNICRSLKDIILYTIITHALKFNTKK